MTTPYHPESGSDGSAVPPPECPAHALGTALDGLDHGIGARSLPGVSPVGPGGVRRLYGPEAENDPMGVYEKLRAEHGTVAPVLLHEDVPAWLVLGHSEALYVTRTPSIYSRDPRHWRLVHDGTVRPDHPLGPLFVWQPFCSHVDGAEHERQRGVVVDAIDHIDTRAARRFINRYSNRLVNEFCQEGRADLVGQFTEHLPMMVMCEILGMPEAYSERLVQAARDLIKGTETALASNVFVMEHLNRLVADRRAEPRDDLTSRMLAHESRFTDDEAAQHLRLVLIAAYETTANLMANVLLMILTDPRFRAQLSGGHMTVPEAVEQTLWDEPPFMAMFGRWAATDSELGGKHIKAGDALVIGIAAANFDPVVRPDPKASMMGNRAHMSFSSGPHECPGQDIGRAIVEVGVDALLMRLPDVALAVDENELRYAAALMSQHLKEMPVEFAPRPPQDIVAPPSSHPHVVRQPDWEITTGPAPAKTSSAALPPQAPQHPPAPRHAAPPAPSGAPGATIPAQRRASAPRRLWQSVSRWWRGY